MCDVREDDSRGRLSRRDSDRRREQRPQNTPRGSGVPLQQFFKADPPERLHFPDSLAEGSRCIDAYVTVETTTVADTMAGNRPGIPIALMQDLLWTFNFQSTLLPERVYETAQQLRLI